MTDEKLLHSALHGGEAEWDDLYKLCSDQDTAGRLHRMLQRNTAEQVDNAEAWIGVLEELHPDLKINSSAPAPSILKPETGLKADKKRTLRILCAEDHEQICELLGRALSEAGHKVKCVFDGQAAWEQLAADPSAFDVLITDHQMPRLSGLDLVKKVRGTTFTGRIVVQSGNLTPELEEAYRALRVDRIVHKTACPGLINDLVAEFL